MRPQPKNTRQRDQKYLDQVRQLPCVLEGRHECAGPIDVCHIRSRGANGSDYQVYSACRKGHSTQHLLGIDTFQKKYGINLYEIALNNLLRIKLV